MSGEKAPSGAGPRLAGFLGARLDEDEAYLRVMIEVGERKAATASPGDMADAYSMAIMLLSDPHVKTVLDRWMDSQVAPPNDLHRLLREVAAKRAILAAYDAAFERRRQHPGDVGSAADLLAMLRTVKILAAVYSDHPDYQQDWKP